MSNTVNLEFSVSESFPNISSDATLERRVEAHVLKGIRECKFSTKDVDAEKMKAAYGVLRRFDNMALEVGIADHTRSFQLHSNSGTHELSAAPRYSDLSRRLAKAISEKLRLFKHVGELEQWLTVTRLASMEDYASAISLLGKKLDDGTEIGKWAEEFFLETFAASRQRFTPGSKMESIIEAALERLVKDHIASPRDSLVQMWKRKHGGKK